MPDEPEEPPRISDAHLRRTPRETFFVLLACLFVTGAIVALIVASSR